MPTLLRLISLEKTEGAHFGGDLALRKARFVCFVSREGHGDLRVLCCVNLSRMAQYALLAPLNFILPKILTKGI